MEKIKTFEEFVNTGNNDAALSESTSGKDIVKVIADYIEYKFQYGSYTNSTPREDLIKFSEGLVAELKKKNIKKIS
jgi:Icc-related predicted phosphoesterase